MYTLTTVYYAMLPVPVSVKTEILHRPCSIRYTQNAKVNLKSTDLPVRKGTQRGDRYKQTLFDKKHELS